MLALDTRSPLPLYAQIAQELERQIDAGELCVGDRLPSEHNLASTFQVGRPTVRQATESLVRVGKLERRRGSGTFVCEPPLRVDLFSLGGTLRSFSQRGIRLRTSLIERPRRVTEGERELFTMTRVGRVGTSAVVLERFELEAEIFPAFDRVAMRGRPLSQVVAEEFRLTPTHADQSFAAVPATAEVAEALELEEGAPVLKVVRTLHFPGAPAAVHALMYCRTDRFEFSHQIGDPHG